MIFQNRTEAGRRLARELAPYRFNGTVVVAFLRGGLPVAAEIADALPHGLVFVRKSVLPRWRELAIAAVVKGIMPIPEPDSRLIDSLLIP
ncbi:hypothetical protein DYH55_20180 [Methylovirgula sp. 4M-Z18]|nr:hypothetical protein DYH55_20180 [Methylovirgula sp. 4M-Z18]